MHTITTHLPNKQNPFYPQSDSCFFILPPKPFSQVCLLLTHIHFSHFHPHSEIIISVTSDHNKFFSKAPETALTIPPSRAFVGMGFLPMKINPSPPRAICLPFPDCNLPDLSPASCIPARLLGCDPAITLLHARCFGAEQTSLAESHHSERISSLLVLRDACVFPSWLLPSQML